MSTQNPYALARDVQTVNINSVAHAAKDVIVMIFGSEIPYWKALNYTSNEENGFDQGGAGVYGHYSSRGSRTFNGNIQISVEEAMKLAALTAGVSSFNSIYDLPLFDIQIIYLSQITKPKIVTLHNVMFDSKSGDITEGDLYLYSTLNFKYQSETNS